MAEGAGRKMGVFPEGKMTQISLPSWWLLLILFFCPREVVLDGGREDSGTVEMT